MPTDFALLSNSKEAVSIICSRLVLLRCCLPSVAFRSLHNGLLLQGTALVAELLPLLRFIQAVVHHASKVLLPPDDSAKAPSASAVAVQPSAASPRTRANGTASTADAASAEVVPVGGALGSAQGNLAAAGDICYQTRICCFFVWRLYSTACAPCADTVVFRPLCL